MVDFNDVDIEEKKRPDEFETFLRNHKAYERYMYNINKMNVDIHYGLTKKNMIRFIDWKSSPEGEIYWWSLDNKWRDHLKNKKKNKYKSMWNKFLDIFR